MTSQTCWMPPSLPARSGWTAWAETTPCAAVWAPTCSAAEPAQDLIDGALGFVRVVESADADVVLTDGALTIGLETDTLISIEEVWFTGGPGNNRLDASTFGGRVRLEGAGGNDILLGTPQADGLVGGEGDDQLLGGLGDDVYEFDADHPLGTDTVVETGGVDTLDFSRTEQFPIRIDLAGRSPGREPASDAGVGGGRNGGERGGRVQGTNWWAAIKPTCSLEAQVPTG